MFDIKLIREQPEMVKENLKKRQNPEILEMIDELIENDKKWREEIAEINKLRQERNRISLEIARLKKEEKPVEEKMREAAEIPERINNLELEVKVLEEKNKKFLMKIPNILHESVPYGKDETENVEIKKWGDPPKFDFAPKNHLEILEGLGMIDTERAAKIAGHGFYYLKGDVVLLDFAIQRFALELLKSRGFTIIEPPFMMRKDAYLGVTDLEFFGEQLYKVEGEDLYLIATSEHPMIASHMDEVFDKDQLPIRWAGVSPCFRKEVGTHGKYTKGLFRVHQFNKIEQIVFCLPEQSWKILEELQKNSEDLYQALGLHYRVVNVCTGDIGIIAAKKYDTEIWMADGQFREVGSNSNCTDYQARRLNMKYREGPGKPPAGFVHTLNNTALATSRTMLAVLEQFQQKDGSVKVPEVLVPFMNGIEFLKKKS
jgi:seryl-tRNA synthetase